ncbi:MAG: threonylcarbamoyl-AMP synthase [Ruminococcaceae bacterium]|nr:threonylcarbamoyl-AMP synthase [Oscillospiraceae bacterium]
MTETFVFPANNESAEKCAEMIKNGGLVAIPTETVYGLGANGLDEEAVLKIFLAKGRPQDNPLILHLADADEIEKYCCDVPETAKKLAQHFWPGPLTMVLKAKDIVPKCTTAGLDTVAVRCPDCDVTRKLISLAGVPVAAPSANTSGRPSPTSAAHVIEDMTGKIEAIIDNGPCTVGVESTIIDLSGDKPRLLRPGGLPLEDIEAIIGDVVKDKAVKGEVKDDEIVRAPGMKYRHYAPKAPVTVVTGKPEDTGRYILENCGANTGIICFDEYAHMFDDCTVKCLGKVADSGEHARRIFEILRAFDGTDVIKIIAQCPEDKGLDSAVVNRLKKAAGFTVIKV